MNGLGLVTRRMMVKPNMIEFIIIVIFERYCFDISSWQVLLVVSNVTCNESIDGYLC